MIDSYFFTLIFQSVSSKLVEEFEGTIWTVLKKGRGLVPLEPPARCVPATNDKSHLLIFTNVRAKAKIDNNYIESEKKKKNIKYND